MLDRCELGVERAPSRSECFLVVLEGAGEGGAGGVEKLRDLRKRHADTAVERDGRAALEVGLAVDAVVGPRARGCDEAERLPVAQRLGRNPEGLRGLADRVLATICHDCD